MQKINVLGAIGAFLNSVQLEIIMPCLELQKEGKINFRCSLTSEIDQSLLDWCDVVICSRSTRPSEIPFFNAVIEKGIPLLYQCDDNFFHIPINTAVGRSHREPSHLYTHISIIENSSLMRVYSQQMVETVGQITNDVSFANAYFDERMVVEQKKSNQNIRIVYPTSRASGDTLQDLFNEDLYQFLRDHPEIEMYFWGAKPNLEKLAKLPNCNHLGFEPSYDSFINKFKEMNFDIGLAPMEDGVFYNSKTNNKYREYGGCKIAGIYSNTPLYSCVTDGENGVLCGSEPSSWYNSLKRLCKDAELRNQICDNAFADVKNNYSFESFKKQLLEDLHKTIDLAASKNETRRRIGFPKKVFLITDSSIKQHPEKEYFIDIVTSRICEMGSWVFNNPALHRWLGDKGSAVVGMSDSLEKLKKLRESTLAKKQGFVGLYTGTSPITLPNYVISVGEEGELRPATPYFASFPNNSYLNALLAVNRIIHPTEAISKPITIVNRVTIALLRIKQQLRLLVYRPLHLLDRLLNYKTTYLYARHIGRERIRKINRQPNK